TVVCFNPSTKLTRVRPAELIVARWKQLSTRRKFVSYFAPLVDLSEDEERLLREVGTGMQVVHERCCGLDVHKKTVVACILMTLANGEVQRHIRTFSTMTAGLLALSDWLESLAVTVIAMESTGIAMLEALMKRATDPEILAELARGRLRQKLPQLQEALDGRVEPHHRLLLKPILAHIAFLEETLEQLQRDIEERLHPFEEAMT